VKKIRIKVIQLERREIKEGKERVYVIETKKWKRRKDEENTT